MRLQCTTKLDDHCLHTDALCRKVVHEFLSTIMSDFCLLTTIFWAQTQT